jgi:hypothetical protein
VNRLKKFYLFLKTASIVATISFSFSLLAEKDEATGNLNRRIGYGVSGSACHCGFDI